MAKNPSRSGVRTVWEKNSPDPLVDLAARCVLAHPECLFAIGRDADEESDTDVRRNVEMTSTPSTSSSGATSTDLRDESTSALLTTASTIKLSIEITADRAVISGYDDETLRNAATERERSRRFVLHKGLRLPAEICETLFSIMHEEGLDLEDNFAMAFSDPEKSRIKSVDLSGSSLTDQGFQALAGHNLRVLNVNNCRFLTTESLESLNKNSEALVDLYVGNTIRFLPEYVFTRMDDDQGGESDDIDDEDRAAAVYVDRGFIINAPNLQRLVIHDLSVSLGTSYFDLLLKPLTKLTHLDLSGAEHREGFGHLKFLLPLEHLTSLVLHNIDELLDDTAILNICTLKKLRHLDISQFDDKRGTFLQPNQKLRSLVESLPQLMSLDISGTNLAGRGAFEADHRNPDAAVGLCDIPGLISRVDRPLDFLGLYRTHNEACCRAHIPAKKVSGDSSEAQILVAGQHYLERPLVLESVLNDLFHIFRYENCSDVKSALDIILLAMDKHPGEKVIQISGSASLYYIVKSELPGPINVKLKRKILSTLLNGMFAHKHDSVMMRNGCLTLCRFQIPQDVLFDYERLVNILLFIVSEHKGEENNFVQRAGICLLNSLACQVDGQQKLLVGNLGAMEKMLELIRDRVQTGTCDDVMETAWSTMWNVTDETPVNCKRFLDGGGMELFLRCKEEFPEKHDLLRNMMGLLGNVAEVPELRSQLMTTNFVAEFKMLLESTSDGIEVSYNAAGVLAHMASDGPEAWTIEEPSRVEVLERMMVAIERWNLTAERNINYRSFEPILRLVKVMHTPQCQHWAVWALANLTSVDMKYCTLIDKEGGLQLLEELINGNVRPAPYPEILKLASVVRQNVAKWRKNHETSTSASLGGLNNDDDDVMTDEGFLVLDG